MRTERSFLCQAEHDDHLWPKHGTSVNHSIHSRNFKKHTENHYIIIMLKTPKYMRMDCFCFAKISIPKCVLIYFTHIFESEFN